jgi:hypothetical protein
MKSARSIEKKENKLKRRKHGLEAELKPVISELFSPCKLTAPWSFLKELRVFLF